MDAIGLFLGDELVEMAAEGGRGEMLVAVGALFVLGGGEFGGKASFVAVLVLVAPRGGFIARVLGRGGLGSVIHCVVWYLGKWQTVPVVSGRHWRPPN